MGVSFRHGKHIPSDHGCYGLIMTPAIWHHPGTKAPFLSSSASAAAKCIKQRMAAGAATWRCLMRSAVGFMAHLWRSVVNGGYIWLLDVYGGYIMVSVVKCG